AGPGAAQGRPAMRAAGRDAFAALAVARLAIASPGPVAPAAPVAAGRGTLHPARPVISVWTAAARWLGATPWPGGPGGLIALIGLVVTGGRDRRRPGTGRAVVRLAGLGLGILGPQAGGPGHADRLDPAVHLKLAEDAAGMGADGVRGDHQLGGDLAGALALGHARQHVELAGAEGLKQVAALPGGLHVVPQPAENLAEHLGREP